MQKFKQRQLPCASLKFALSGSKHSNVRNSIIPGSIFDTSNIPTECFMFGLIEAVYWKFFVPPQLQTHKNVHGRCDSFALAFRLLRFNSSKHNFSEFYAWYVEDICKVFRVWTDRGRVLEVFVLRGLPTPKNYTRPMRLICPSIPVLMLLLFETQFSLLPYLIRQRYMQSISGLVGHTRSTAISLASSNQKEKRFQLPSTTFKPVILAQRLLLFETKFPRLLHLIYRGYISVLKSVHGRGRALEIFFFTECQKWLTRRAKTAHLRHRSASTASTLRNSILLRWIFGSSKISIKFWRFRRIEAERWNLLRFTECENGKMSMDGSAHSRHTSTPTTSTLRTTIILSSLSDLLKISMKCFRFWTKEAENLVNLLLTRPTKRKNVCCLCCSFAA